MPDISDEPPPPPEPVPIICLLPDKSCINKATFVCPEVYPAQIEPTGIFLVAFFFKKITSNSVFW